MRRILALLISFCLVFEQAGFAQVASQPGIPTYLSAVSPAADRFRPVHLRSLSIKQGADDINVLLDKGDSAKVQAQEIKDTTRKLMEYFQIGLRLPNSMFWVNLRPDAPREIIDPYLEKTDLGKVLLEADLQLKKDLAKFTDPSTSEGKQYWDRLYARAEQLYGSGDIEIPTVTRPWIVPGEIIIGESENSAYVYKATLKVMLEQDYLKDSVQFSFDDERAQQMNAYSSQLVRELIIPKLIRHVNASKQYASLRQVYYSLILAQWFKARNAGREGNYAGQIDSRDLVGLTSQKAWSKDTYFKAYQKSFTHGEYNREESVFSYNGMAVRRYFSGGAALMSLAAPVRSALASTTAFIHGAPAIPRHTVSVVIGPDNDIQIQGPFSQSDAKEEGIEGLIQQVLDQDITTPMREAAVRKLGETGSAIPRVISVLRTAARQNSDQYVRFFAIDALIKLGQANEDDISLLEEYMRMHVRTKGHKIDSRLVNDKTSIADFTLNVLFRTQDFTESGMSLKILWKIYSHPEFIKRTAKIRSANRFSIARSIELTLQRFDVEATESNIEKALTAIITNREALAEKVILGPHTQFIAFSAQTGFFESPFRPENLKRFALRFTHQNNIAVQAAPPRDSVLDTVENLAYKKEGTVIMFYSHGSPHLLGPFKRAEALNVRALMRLLRQRFTLRGTPFDFMINMFGLIRDIRTWYLTEQSRLKMVNVSLLAERLAKRAEKAGKLDDITIIIDCCYGGDFAVNLLNQLAARGYKKEFPTIIASTNRLTVGYLNVFLKSIGEVTRGQEQLRYSHIFDAEENAARAREGARNISHDFAIITPNAPPFDASMQNLPAGTDNQPAARRLTMSLLFLYYMRWIFRRAGISMRAAPRQLDTSGHVRTDVLVSYDGGLQEDIHALKEALIEADNKLKQLLNQLASKERISPARLDSYANLEYINRPVRDLNKQIYDLKTERTILRARLALLDCCHEPGGDIDNDGLVKLNDIKDFLDKYIEYYQKNFGEDPQIILFFDIDETLITHAPDEKDFYNLGYEFLVKNPEIFRFETSIGTPEGDAQDVINACIYLEQLARTAGIIKPVPGTKELFEFVKDYNDKRQNQNNKIKVVIITNRNSGLEGITNRILEDTLTIKDVSGEINLFKYIDEKHFLNTGALNKAEFIKKYLKKFPGAIGIFADDTQDNIENVIERLFLRVFNVTRETADIPFEEYMEELRTFMTSYNKNSDEQSARLELLLLNTLAKILGMERDPREAAKKDMRRFLSDHEDKINIAGFHQPFVKNLVRKIGLDGGERDMLSIGELCESFPDLADNLRELIAAKEQNALSKNLFRYYEIIDKRRFRRNIGAMAALNAFLGIEQVHAQLIKDTVTGKGILILGNKGVGKSTITQFLITGQDLVLKDRYLLAGEDSVDLIYTEDGVYAGVRNKTFLKSIARDIYNIMVGRAIPQIPKPEFMGLERVVYITLHNEHLNKVYLSEDPVAAIKEWEQMEQKDVQSMIKRTLSDTVRSKLTDGTIPLIKVDVPVEKQYRNYEAIALQIGQGISGQPVAADQAQEKVETDQRVEMARKLKQERIIKQGLKPQDSDDLDAPLVPVQKPYDTLSIDDIGILNKIRGLLQDAFGPWAGAQDMTVDIMEDVYLDYVPTIAHPIGDFTRFFVFRTFIEKLAEINKVSPVLANDIIKTSVLREDLEDDLGLTVDQQAVIIWFYLFANPLYGTEHMTTEFMESLIISWLERSYPGRFDSAEIAARVMEIDRKFKDGGDRAGGLNPGRIGLKKDEYRYRYSDGAWGVRIVEDLSEGKDTQGRSLYLARVYRFGHSTTDRGLASPEIIAISMQQNGDDIQQGAVDMSTDGKFLEELFIRCLDRSLESTLRSDLILFNGKIIVKGIDGNIYLLPVPGFTNLLEHAVFGKGLNELYSKSTIIGDMGERVSYASFRRKIQDAIVSFQERLKDDQGRRAKAEAQFAERSEEPGNRRWRSGQTQLRSHDSSQRPVSKKEDTQTTLNDFGSGADGGGKGGIDMRALPITARPIEAVTGVLSPVAPVVVDPAILAQLKQQWGEIELSMQKGPMPYQDIREYIDVCKKQGAQEAIDGVFVCIAELLRMEEDRAVATPAELKEILISIG